MSNYKVSLDLGIAIIAFDTLEHLNGFTHASINELITLIDEFENNDDVKVIILEGQEKYFCIGGASELLDHVSTLDFEGKVKIVREVQKIIYRIRSAKIPIIAFVNGLAAGAGFDIMMACDRIFINDDTRISLAFSKLNLIPDLGGLYFLKEKVGTQNTLTFYSECPTWDSKQSNEYGIGEHLPFDQMSHKQWEKTLRLTLKTSKHAYGIAKYALWQLSKNELTSHMNEISKNLAELYETELHKDKLQRLRAMQSIQHVKNKKD